MTKAEQYQELLYDFWKPSYFSLNGQCLDWENKTPTQDELEEFRQRVFSLLFTTNVSTN